MAATRGGDRVEVEKCAQAAAGAPLYETCGYSG
jgi:hypothetical protein